VDSAFALCSSIAVVFNYPTFPSVENTRGLYLGHTITEEDLPEEYQTLVQKPGPKILIALGTFLSSRIDVLRKLISIVLKFEPGSQIFVGAGSGAPLLQQEFDSRVKISKFLPQRALLPQVDLVIHHGGVSSFTESLYHAVPMLVLPFSSDQFNVALDVEVNHLGRVCDPNAITEETVHSAWQALKSPQVMASLKHWSSRIRELGPHKAARILQTGG
jgi:UDP:flavonoid glycosyltransferase YjiC (YdhE family)